jgi:hypothetical protein
MHMVNTLLKFIYTDKQAEEEKIEEESKEISLDDSNMDNVEEEEEEEEVDDYVSGEGVRLTSPSGLKRKASLDKAPRAMNTMSKKISQVGGSLLSSLTTTSDHSRGAFTTSKKLSVKIPCRSHNIMVGILVHRFEEMMPEVETDSRVQAFFDKLKLEKLNYDMLKKGFREVLHLNETEMTEEEMDVVYEAVKEVDSEFVTWETLESFLGGGGRNINYKGIFVDCEAGSDGKIYEEDRIWSTDVAANWVRQIRGQDGKDPLWPCKYHQHILRSCNLQHVLYSALEIESDVAYTGGSQSTIGLKVESQRRLTQAKTALLTLAKAFVTGDHDNQEIMFK